MSRTIGARGLVTLLSALAALCALFAAPASATLYQHPFKEVFGPSEQPGFNLPRAVVADHATGDVLVLDRGGDAQQNPSFSGFSPGDQFTLANLPGACSGSSTEPIEFATSPESALASAIEAKLEEKCGANFYVSGDLTHGGINVYFTNAFAEAPQPLLSCAVVSGHGSGSCTVQTFSNGAAQALYRFHADGTTAPFADLGTNAIDGKGSGHGPGSGGTCVPVSLECDETPQNGLSVGFEMQVAVDESGGPTDGDIYLTQPHAIDIFSAAGEYLGQLTKGLSGSVGNATGVAVDASGAVYVAGQWEIGAGASNYGIRKYVPSANPPVDADNVAFFELREGIGLPEGGTYGGPKQIALGAGPSVGQLFVTSSTSPNGTPVIVEMNAETGEYHKFVEGYGHGGVGETAIAVDPASGNVLTGKEGDYKADTRASLVEFDGSGEIAGEPLSRLFPPQNFYGFAYSSTGDVYLGAFHGLGEEGGRLLTYGHPAIVPTPTAEEPSEVGGTEATLNGTVEPDGTEVEECFFEWGQVNEFGNIVLEHTAPCEQAVPFSADTQVSAKITGLTPGGATYYFRLAAKNENGVEQSSTLSFASAHYATTDPATVTGTETATLNGTVRDEGAAVEECFFEWGLASNPGYETSVPCEPEAGAIPVDEGPHPVGAPLSGLSEQTAYRFRLVIERAGETYEGDEETFETFGPPQISEVRARDATQGEAKIEAKIDPSGFDTSYRFEWGPTESYGNSVPVSPESIGTATTRVGATLSGLSPGSAYHYRVLATNSTGTTETPDQTLETLNSCGLVEARCFELVSSRDPFPANQPGSLLVATELYFQAASQPGALAFEAEAGEADATRGSQILYRGSRSEAGWSSSQLSPPVKVPDRQSGVNSSPSVYFGFSPTCGAACSPPASR